MSYSLQRDDVLHSFFYGTETLPDIAVASGLFSAETNKLYFTPDARPMLPEVLVWSRYTNFVTRLNLCLSNLATNGQPEIPRLVGHTLRLLYLLRDTHLGNMTNSPPPALELGRETNSLSLLLYGEPYAHYSLLESTNLDTWSTTTVTNLHNEQSLPPPNATTPRRYYRAVLPVP